MPRHLPFSDSPLLPLRRLPFVSTVGCAYSTAFQCGYAWHVMTSQTSPSSPMRAAQASPEWAPFTLLLGACRDDAGAFFCQTAIGLPLPHATRECPIIRPPVSVIAV